MSQRKRPAETDLIQKWFAPLAGPAGLGLADDAACLVPRAGHDLVMTMDTIVEGTHFLATDTPREIAIKAVTVNRSDLVAKGADAIGYLLAITFPSLPDENWMADFAAGLEVGLAGKLLGGDVTSGSGPLTISVTAIGEVPKGGMVHRKGGRPGDVIFVSGPIGSSWCGLKCQTDSAWLQTSGLSGADVDTLKKAYSAPRLIEPEMTAKLVRDFASASMDISDGLAIDLDRICDASGVGAYIDLSDIPLAGPVRKLVSGGCISWTDIVTGGDDYVTLFAVPQDRVTAFEAAKSANVVRIGKLQEQKKGVIWQDSVFGIMDISDRKGYDHFS